MSSPRAIQTSMGPAEWGLLILLGAIWGGSFFFARIAVAEIPPLTLVLLRVGIAAIALHLWLALRGPSFALALPHWQLFLALGITNNVIPFSLIFLGQTELGAGIASVLNSTTPFWTIVIANAVTSDEKLSWNKVVGVLFGIAGTAIMIGPGLIAGLGGPVWAKFALIGASVSYAVALLVARHLRVVPPTVVATGQLTVSTLVMLPIALLAGGSAGFVGTSAHVWAAVFGLALLSTSFAYLLYFVIIARAAPPMPRWSH
jgi:drug/metabolite transporter (DMT)-like permease